VPTLLTVFTICASVEIAGRLHGGKGVLGWLTALPWHNPVMLGAALSFIMLGFGGAGGLINMSYQLNATVHNTQWITGHFHLIFAGAIVIMYFVIAYDIWPHLTGRALDAFGLMRAQLWLWFVGMIVLTFPWHWVGILGMPRRMAFYDYADPAIAAQGPWVTMWSSAAPSSSSPPGCSLSCWCAGTRRRASSRRRTGSASPCGRRARCRPRSTALGSGLA
jgi:cytochrome c oxidase subunit I